VLEVEVRQMYVGAFLGGVAHGVGCRSYLHMQSCGFHQAAYMTTVRCGGGLKRTGGRSALLLSCA
jgi:hypothetical protein